MAAAYYHDLTNSTKESAATVVAKYTITSANDTAGTVSLTLEDLPAITGAIVQTFASNGDRKGEADILVTWSGKVLTLADGTTDAITSGDVVVIYAFGVVSE